MIVMNKCKQNVFYILRSKYLHTAWHTIIANVSEFLATYLLEPVHCVELSILNVFIQNKTSTLKFYIYLCIYSFKIVHDIC